MLIYGFMQNRRVGWVRLGRVGLFNVLINDFMLNSLGDDFGDLTFKGLKSETPQPRDMCGGDLTC